MSKEAIVETDKSLTWIEIGDQVQNSLLEGFVQSIAVCAQPGHPPIIRVVVQKEGGVPVAKPYLYASEGPWVKLLPTPSDDVVVPDTCPSCGEVHGTGPFTPEMFATFIDACDGTPEEREDMLIELAHLFTMEISPLDEMIPDGIHRMVSKALTAQDKANTATLRLGRTVARHIADILQHTHGSEDESFPALDKKSGKIGMN